MAYTYDDFISAAKGANMLDRFSQQDLVTAQKNPEFGLSMLSLQKDLDSAATEEQRLLAGEAANQLRKTYGSYTQDAAGNPSFAGGYGAQIDKTMDQLNNYGSFNFSGQEDYKKLQEQIANQQPFQYGSEDAYQKLLQNVTNPQPFTYDPETDPRMAAYKKMYLREGDRATANTLAKASTGTGGVPSSFAVTAAQQAGNYYAGQLADIIPTLYQQSYEQYLNDQNLKQGALGALRSDRDYENQQYLNQYNMLMNLLGNMQTERDYENQQYLNRYNMLQNQLGNLQTQQNTQYNQFLDALNHAYRVQQDQLGQDLQQQQLAEAAKQQEFNNALALYQVLGYMTPEMEKILLGTNPVIAGTGDNTSFDGVNDNYRVTTSLTEDQIRQLQGALGVTSDGWIGSETMGALGGLTPEEAYSLLFEQEPSSDSTNEVPPAGDVPDYDNIQKEVLEMIRNGESYSDAAELVNAAYEEGIITATQQSQILNAAMKVKKYN